MMVFTNTRTRKKESFAPRDSTTVRMYTCGPTVYNVAHIGNFMAYIDADIVQRYLRFWKGLDIQWVMNITDVDDKIIRDSAIEYPDVDPNDRLQKFTQHYEKLFFEDLASVGVDLSHIDAFPRATEYVAGMQALIQRIRDAGYAYEKEGSVYFDLKKYHESGRYGELSNVDFSGFRAGVRIDADEYEKDNVQDFVLWKAHKEGEPVWEFEMDGVKMPGRPGWHIECSVMSSEHLGDVFDIHTGGVDLIFPHHENEIAQSTTGNGKRHADMWLHNEHLQVDGGKMSKSKGNFYTLRDIIGKGYDPKTFRMLVASSHYRSKLNFTFDSMDAAREKIARLDEVIRKLQRVTAEGKGTLDDAVSDAARDFEEAMDDDLNTPQALAVVFDFVRDVNSIIDSCTQMDAYIVLEFLKKVNGVFAVMTFEQESLPADLQQLIDERGKARLDKDFSRSDELRKVLREKGIEVEDTPDGTVWRMI